MTRASIFQDSDGRHVQGWLIQPPARRVGWRLARVVRRARVLSRELALLALMLAIIFGATAGAVSLLDWAEGREPQVGQALSQILSSLGG